jgi:ribonuclease Z
LEALTVGTQGHTSPEQFGKVMSMVEPRLAVGYHFYNDFDIKPEMMRRIRKLYDGPLELAVDYMVFNVTKDSINVRMSAVDEEIWPSPPIRDKIAPDVGELGFSPFTISGALPMIEVVQPLYDEINEMYGTDFEPFFKGEDPEE